MSYDVDNFKVKKLDHFCIPGLFDAHGDIDPFILNGLDNVETCDFEQAPIDNVISIDYGGEGSGRSYDKFIELLKKSTGVLEAIVVWEGGDTLKKIKIENGVYSEEDL